MAKKPTYEELEQRIKELEIEVAKGKRVKKELTLERDIFMKGPVVVFKWSVKENWPAKYVSSNVAQFGYHADDFTSNKLLYIDIIHPEDLERVKSEVQAHIESGINFYEQEYRIIQADGKETWVYDHTVVHRDDKNEIMNFEGYILDNTERKQVEKALMESEGKFKMITEQSLMGIAIIQDGYYKYVNETMSKINKYSVEEMMNFPRNGYAKLFLPGEVGFIMEQGRKKQSGDRDVVTNY